MYEKFYCANCGKWLGIKRIGSDSSGFFPYCGRCKRNVPIKVKRSEKQESAYHKCQSADK